LAWSSLASALLVACSTIDVSDPTADGGIACVTKDECPGKELPCEYRTCEDGVCGVVLIGAGFALPDDQQPKGLCVRLECDAQGIDQPKPIDDPPVPNSECVTTSCDLAATSIDLDKPPIIDGFVEQGTSCTENEGAVCDGAGSCVACLIDSDCPADCSGNACKCQQNACVSALCDNMVKDGDETDVDCGGPACNPCPNGGACALEGDCASGVCLNSVCQAATCTDSVWNGTETDVDCGGGSNCDRCASGKACQASDGSDCDSKVCEQGVCKAPSCKDTKVNGSETDVDCGGSDCDGCQQGKACSTVVDCTEGLTCLNNACSLLDGNAQPN
jgi:hypothetical protein